MKKIFGAIKIAVGIMLVLNSSIYAKNFKIAVLPDTQYYSMMYPDIYVSQTRWIAKNYKEQDIRFTVHLGDIVQNALIVREWANAMKAMSYLDLNSETPYSIASGNHDVPSWFIQDDMRILGLSMFLKYFPADLQKMRFKTFQEADNTGYSSYHIFEDFDGQEYLVLALDWRVGDNTIKWANEILKKYSNLPTILTSHEILDLQNGKTFLTDNGKRLWKKLIKSNPQIFLGICGHNYGTTKLIKKNDSNQEVLLLMIDFQDQKNGGNGMLSLIDFDKTDNKLKVSSYSPWVELIPQWQRSYDDKLTSWSYNYDINFTKRFSK